MTPDEAEAALRSLIERNPDQAAEIAIATVRMAASSELALDTLVELLDKVQSNAKAAREDLLNTLTIARRVESLFASHKKVAARKLLRELAAIEPNRDEPLHWEPPARVRLSDVLTGEIE